MSSAFRARQFKLFTWSERIEYYSCEIPEVVEKTRDPMRFFRQREHRVVILDEVHYLPDPSRLLKIGADEFPRLKILATGSSTLAASRKFRDTLAGRKRVVHLTPILAAELQQFGGIGLERRLYHGGLPQALLSSEKDPGFYREWLDSFFARDIQRLFAFRDVDKFTSLFEYLMRQSGGLFEITRTAREVGIGRPTVESHLRALQACHALTLVRPFHRGGGQKEIVKRPRCYCFDTGFVSFCRGWNPLRAGDRGILWEHLVLEAAQAYSPDAPLFFWRDQAGHEVDFVNVRSRDSVDAIECKWDPDQFEPSGIAAFRSTYSNGGNYLVCPSVEHGYAISRKGIDVHVCGLEGIRKLLW